MAVRTTVRRWSGLEIRALREAQRMSLREFAARLGVSDRMISKWEAGGAEIHPRPVNQAALDTLLAHADPDVHTRFSLLLSDHLNPPARPADLPRPDPVATSTQPEPAPDGVTVRQRHHLVDGKLMSLVEGGRFLAGADNTARHVDAFYIDVHPVTNAEYERFVAATGHRAPGHWRDQRIPAGLDEHPVVFVSWRDAHAYAAWCRKSLPTSAQWEKAARGVDGTVYPWGNQDTPAKCNVRGSGPATTTPTGQYRSGASPYEVYDLCGNVWEWCADETHSGRRELRGGAFSSPFHRSKPAEFNDASPDMHDDDTGFRCVTLPHALAPSDESEDMKRRDLLRLIGVSGATIALPVTELVGNETPDRGGLVDLTDQKGYDGLNATLWRLYSNSPDKASVLPLVSSHLGILAGGLRDSTTTSGREHLMRLLADMWQLAGEISFDRNNYIDAAHCYTLAATAGKEAGDYDLWACALTRHSFISLYGHDFEQAVPMLNAAAALARRGDQQLTTRFWVSTVAAQVHAGRDDLGSCERALDHASEVLTGHHTTSDTGWLRFSGARLAEESGACYVELGLPDRAAESLEAALTLESSTRRAGAIHADLAIVGVQRRDREFVATHVTHALSAARATNSGYLTTKLAAASTKFGPLMSDRTVRDLTAQIAALR